jgi:hypothetical protein
MKQFKQFFSHKFSKLFVAICVGVVVAGAIHAGYVVSNLKQDIDIKIAQREEVIKGIMTPYVRSFLINTGGVPDSYYNYDAVHNELRRIKATSPFRLFVEKFGFGWWGIIALLTALLINILILFYKLMRVYLPLVFLYGNTQTKSIKTNMQGMAPFQQYSLALLTIAVLTLIVIATAIIF